MITLLSPAKINLYLEIKNKRKDGYHNLKTIFQEVNLFDTIIFKKTKKEIKIASKANIPLDEKNLAFKAADLFFRLMKINDGLSIKIIKRIPVGSGLGGGSSNAATTLKAINLLWNLNLTSIELEKIGTQIGADVPFFIKGGTAYAEGIGEKLTSFPFLENVWIVIIYPEMNISTALIYSNWDKLNIKERKKVKNIKESFIKKNLVLIGENLYNSLEKVILHKYPKIKKIKEKLNKLEVLGSLVSGTGSSIFALAENKIKAEKIYKEMKSIYPTYLVKTNISKNLY